MPKEGPTPEEIVFYHLSLYRWMNGGIEVMMYVLI